MTSPQPRASDGDRTRGPILIPVVNPASAQPLLRCAAALASTRRSVIVLTVVSPTVDDATRATVERQLADATALAVHYGLDATSEIAIADDVAQGIVATMQRATPAMVMIGWRGETSTYDVCGQLIDRIVGRAATPIAVLRAGASPPTYGILPVSADHLLPGGSGGLHLTMNVAANLRQAWLDSLTVLATGIEAFDVPTELKALADTVIRDERRIHQAVAGHDHAEAIVIAPVAPTAVGLRAATTHLAWSAPQASLLVTVDPGPATSQKSPALEIDARGKACPIPVIELAEAIDTVEIGDRVTLFATDPAAKVDVPVWCRMRLQRLVSVRTVDGVDEFVVERRS